MELKQLLEAYMPDGRQEQTAKEAILNGLEQQGTALLERTEEQHMTVSAVVMNPALDRLLMVHHNVYQSFSWPGGHADGTENLLEKALEEVREETGISTVYPISSEILSLDVLEAPGHVKNGAEIPPHWHYNAGFGCIAPERQELRVKPDENSRVEWIAAEDIAKSCTEAHMLPLYQKIIARMREIEARRKRLYGLLPDACIPWYLEHARELPWRRDKDPYHVWVSEIMLQQTRVEAVKKYYTRFLDAFPTVQALAQAGEGRLMKLWEGLGYYSRARNLQKAAKKIVEDFAGRFPENYDDILSLPGVGAYTAGAISSICFEQPAPAVDGNVLRVIARIMEDYEDIGTPQMKAKITAALQSVYPAGQCGDFTQSLMELGATVCLPDGQPLCGQCPAARFCRAHKNGTELDLPVKAKKKARRIEEKTVFLLRCGSWTAVCRREDSGLLAGLWQFPNVPGALTEEQAIAQCEAWGAEPVDLERAVRKKHIFTHVEWHMMCYHIRCKAAPPQFTWAEPADFQHRIALPTAFRKFL